MAPWTQFAWWPWTRPSADLPLAGVVAPTEIAHAVVALYLGWSCSSHLDGDRQPALALFERARQLAMLADLVTGFEGICSASVEGNT